MTTTNGHEPQEKQHHEKVQEKRPNPITKNMGRVLAIFLISTALNIGIGGLIGSAMTTNYWADDWTREQYYRAHYDACMSFTAARSTDNCNNFAADLEEDDWYNHGYSRGFNWPLPEPTEVPTPTPQRDGA